jgi:hypothetical protein
MKTQDLGFEDALEVVRQRRRWAAPNGGFREQLTLYEKLNYDTQTPSEELKALEKNIRKPTIEMWVPGSAKTFVEY